MAKKASSKSKKRADKPAGKAIETPPTTGPAKIKGPTVVVAQEFNILTRTDDAALKVQEQLLDMSKRRTTNPRPGSFIPADKVKRKLLPHSHFLMQWLTDNYGYPSSGLINYVGDEQCGKTTKMLSDCAHIMLERNSPLLYLSCEGREKTMARDRMLRCMHTDPKIAIKLLHNIHIDYLQSVLQLQPKLTSWAKVQREGAGSGKDATPGIPMDIPLLVIVDPFSRLLNVTESSGNIVWDGQGKEKQHEVGTSKFNVGHAKFGQEFCRWLPSFVDTYNVLVFVAHARTTHIDMGGGGSYAAMNMSEWKKALMDYNFVGSKAFEALASMTFIITSKELIKHPITKKVTGRRVRVRMKKQSHGIAERFASWELRMDHEDWDIPGTYLDPAIQYGEGFCNMLKDEKQFGLRVGDDGLVTVPDLNLRGLTVQAVDGIMHAQPDTLEQLGRRLNISGYVDMVDNIIQQVKKDAEKST